MSKRYTTFNCQGCGAVYNRWQGRCEACGEWNSIVEEVVSSAESAPIASGGARLKKGRVIALEDLSGEAMDAPRLASGFAEFDRVTGGGFVKGSVILLGGEPGIGKSTLLIQAAASISKKGARTIYISGEESIGQVRLRAQRLGLADAPVELGAETHVEDIIATLGSGVPPRLVIIDSIQTMWTDAVEAAPGTVTQVRASSQALIRFAKTSGAAIILVGHVTKDGQIAGPRVVEHMVDSVMNFEGDATHHFRILRAAKNRFGATDEIGVFEMGSSGLVEVPNPSALFLGARDASVSGTAVFAGMEGTRPMLIEVQALVTPSSLASPRRAVVGWDNNRLAMVLAVLEARGGVRFGQYDVYLNVAGGFKIIEPAADLAVAASLVSSLTDVPLSINAVFCGEVSLSGLIRPVPQVPSRLKESAKLGFSESFLPDGLGETGEQTGIKTTPLRQIADLVAQIAGGAKSAKRK